MRFVKLIVATLCLFSQQSLAKTYLIQLSGSLVSQTNSGPDQNLAVGSNFTVTARFNDQYFTHWGNNGYSVAGLYGLPTTGKYFFRIEAPGMTWQSFDEQSDGDPIYQAFRPTEMNGFGAPAIIFNDTGVLGLAGKMTPVVISDRPVLRLGSFVQDGVNDTYDPDAPYLNFPPAELTNQFSIESPNGLYNNYYTTPGFSGLWDFATSKVTAVPEPSTWALMILGFISVGASMRRASRSASNQLPGIVRT